MATPKYDLNIPISEHELRHLINMYADCMARSMFRTESTAKEFIVNARRFNTLLTELDMTELGKSHAK